jgi:hypothetical protein
LPPIDDKSQCFLSAAAFVSDRARDGLVPATWRFQFGVVVPIPTFPAVSMKIVEVPTAVFVPLKYVTWPVDPETELPPTHVPPIEKQPSVRSIPVAKVEVADEPVWLR